MFEEVRAILDRATPLTDKLKATVRSTDTLYRLVEATPINLPAYNDLLEKSIVVMDKLAGILAEAKPLCAAISGDTNLRADSLLGKFVGLADHLFWRAMLLV